MPSVSEKPKLTFLPEVDAAAGPESIVGVGGATASTVHVRVRGADVLPSVSIARTWKVCEPSVRFVYALGEVSGFQPIPSRLTSNVAEPSVSEKANETSGPLVEAAPGPESIVGTAGGVVSTVKEREAEKPERTPWLSIAFACQ